MTWLSDPIYAIREQSMQALYLISKLFGPALMNKVVIPKLLSFQTEENLFESEYLTRIFPLIAESWRRTLMLTF
jgi:hypothetical protein